MSKTGKSALNLPILGALGVFGLMGCGGGGSSSSTPMVQPFPDSQQPVVLINISAGFGPATWVLFQYDQQSQLYNVFINRKQLPVPASERRPDIGVITSDPNNWEPYAKSAVTVQGTTISLTLDNGSAPNIHTATSQELSDFVSQNSSLTQMAWNEIGQK
jgi:hypothetical protein